MLRVINYTRRLGKPTLLLLILCSFLMLPTQVEAQTSIPQIDLSIGGGGSEDDDFSSAIQALVIITVLSFGAHLSP